MKERDTGGNKYVLKKGYRKYTVFQAEGSFKVVKKSFNATWGCKSKK